MKSALLFRSGTHSVFDSHLDVPTAPLPVRVNHRPQQWFKYSLNSSFELNIAAAKKPTSTFQLLKNIVRPEGIARNMEMSNSILANSNVEEIFQFKSEAHHHSLVTKLSELRDDSRFRDVTLVAEGVRINAHRVVLASYSDYFKAMFTSEMRECRQQEIEMFDVEAPALDALINFCYCGKIRIDGINVPSMLHAACLLQLNEVKEACCEFLRRQLRPSKCLGIRALADNHSCHELVRYADEYILKVFQELIGTEEFHQIPENQLVKLISSEGLVVPSEEQVFTAVLQWVEFDLSSRKHLLPKLMEHVRFSLCRPDFLVDTVSKSALVMMDATCHSIVDQAKNDMILQLSIPERPKMEKRWSRACGLVADVIYVVGGEDNRNVECLNLRGADTVWHLVTPFSQGSSTGVAVVDGFIYALCRRCAGTKSLNSIERYNASTDQWRSVAPCPIGGHLHGVTAIDHHLYVVGGFEKYSWLDTVERYDVRRNEWTYVASMSSRRAAPSVSVLDGCLYAVGGYSTDTPLNTVERFDPRVGRWEEVCPMSTPRLSLGSAVLNGELYAVGGRNRKLGVLRSAEKFDPRANKWTSVTNMSCSRDELGLAAVHGKLYAIGGFGYNSVEVFDPETNQWEHHSYMNCTHECPGVAALPEP